MAGIDNHTLVMMKCHDGRFVNVAKRNHTLELQGDAYVDTTNVKFAASVYGDGSGDGISVTSGSDLAWRLADFTIDFQCRCLDATHRFLTGATTDYQWLIAQSHTDATKLALYINGIAWEVGTGTTTISDSVFHHIAFERYGDIFTLYVDGNIEVQTTSTDFDWTWSTLAIGGMFRYDLYGNIEEYRVSDIARYQATAFTPPSEAYTWVESEEELEIVKQTAYNVTALVYDDVSYALSSENSYPKAVTFRPDGSKMYMIGAGTKTVYQYSLSTPWDTETLSYDSVSLDISGQETTPSDLKMSSDGTKLYCMGYDVGYIHQYTLSTPWDLSTASYDSVYLNVAANVSVPTGFYIGDNGSKIYATGYSTYVCQYTLTTPWDLSTASYDDISFNILTDTDSSTYGLDFDSTGKRMLVCGAQNGVIYQFELTDAWNLKSLFYTGFLKGILSEDSQPWDVCTGNDGTKLYMVGANNKYLYQYTFAEKSGSGVGASNNLICMQADGVEGTSTITDTCGNTWTNSGSPEISNFKPRFGSGALRIPEYSTSYTYTTNASCDFGTANPFCIDFWFYTGLYPNTAFLYNQLAESSGRLVVSVSSNKLILNLYGCSSCLTSTDWVLLNSYYHVALVGDENYVYMYLNGKYQCSYARTGSDLGDVDFSTFVVGHLNTSDAEARIDQIRVSGVCRINDSTDPLYISSGNPEDGFPCPFSDYIRYCTAGIDFQRSIKADYRQIGLDLSRSSRKQADAGIDMQRSIEQLFVRSGIDMSKDSRKLAIAGVDLERDVSQNFRQTGIDLSKDSRKLTTSGIDLYKSIRQIATSGVDMKRRIRQMATSGIDISKTSRKQCKASLDISREIYTRSGFEVWIDGSIQGFIERDAEPLALSGISDTVLPVGDHTIEIRPSGWLWKAGDPGCRFAKTLSVNITAGGEVGDPVVPAIENLSASQESGYTVITWTLPDVMGADDVTTFGLWFGSTSPVDVSGDPDVTISCYGGSGQYTYYHSQTASEYVAVAAFIDDSQGDESEIYLELATAAPLSPAGQWAEEN